MVNSELVATLRVLSKDEQQRLTWFVQSPYFNEGREARNEGKLIACILDYLGNAPQREADLDPETLYHQIYSGRAYAAQTMNNLSASSLRLVRQFLAVEMTQRSDRPVFAHRQQLGYFTNKGAYDLGEKYIKRLEREVEKINSPDDLDFLYNWLAEEAKTDFLYMLTEVTDDFNLQGSLLALEHFFLIKRLYIVANLFNQNRLTPVLKEGQMEAYLREIDAWADKPFFQDPIVQLSRKALDFLALEDPVRAEQEFDAFMALFSEHEETLSLDYKKRFESFAYNFCVGRFNQPKYRNLLFDIFRRKLNPDRLKPEETIQATLFLSLVKTGLVGEEFELIKSFLDTYRTRIVGRHASEEYYQFCLALYHFYTNELDKARNIIITLNFHEPLYKFFCKTLEVKIFFDSGESDFDLVEDKLNALRVAVHRERKMSERNLTPFRHFANFMYRLHRLRCQPQVNPQKLQELIREVDQTQESVSEKIWLLKTLRQLQDGLDNTRK